MSSLLTSPLVIQLNMFRIKDWHIVEYEIKGENGFYIKLRRENPAKQGAVTGSITYYSFLSSVIETLHKPPGFNLC